MLPFLSHKLKALGSGRGEPTFRSQPGTEWNSATPQTLEEELDSILPPPMAGLGGKVLQQPQDWEEQLLSLLSDERNKGLCVWDRLSSLLGDQLSR